MVWLQNLYDAYLRQDESHVNLLPFVREGVTTCGALPVSLATMRPLLPALPGIGKIILGVDTRFAALAHIPFRVASSYTPEPEVRNRS